LPNGASSCNVMLYHLPAWDGPDCDRKRTQGKPARAAAGMLEVRGWRTGSSRTCIGCTGPCVKPVARTDAITG